MVPSVRPTVRSYVPPFDFGHFSTDSLTFFGIRLELHTPLGVFLLFSKFENLTFENLNLKKFEKIKVGVVGCVGYRWIALEDLYRISYFFFIFNVKHHPYAPKTEKMTSFDDVITFEQLNRFKRFRVHLAGLM